VSKNDVVRSTNMLEKNRFASLAGRFESVEELIGCISRLQREFKESHYDFENASMVQKALGFSSLEENSATDLDEIDDNGSCGQCRSGTGTRYGGCNHCKLKSEIRVSLNSVSARLEEDEHTRDGSREIAIDIMATSTTY